MAVYTRFDDVPDLVGYWSAAESAIDKTGNVVNSVQPVYPGGAPVLYNRDDVDKTHDVFHDGVTKIGQCLAFFDDSAGNRDSALYMNRASDPSTEPLTVLVVEQRAGNLGVQESWMYGTPTLTHSRVRRDTSTDRYQIQQRSDSEVSDITITTDPVIHVYRTDPSGYPTFDVRRQGANLRYQSIDISSPISTAWTHFYWMGTRNQYSLRGKACLLAMYNRRLTDQETIDLLTLAQYWIDNGEAPVLGPPTTGQFGPVATSDDGQVDVWQWEESANNADWQNVGTLLTDTTGMSTNTLVVNSAPLSANGTYVRCKATGTAFPTGIVSDSAQLFVEAGS
jgi:hypothetical protein